VFVVALVVDGRPGVAALVNVASHAFAFPGVVGGSWPRLRASLCAPRKIVRFWRQPLVGARQLIGRLARGRDTAATAPVLLADGSVEVFFDRYDFGCRTGASDIYKFVIPAP
jgi:hypothetical protein